MVAGLIHVCSHTPYKAPKVNRKFVFRSCFHSAYFEEEKSSCRRKTKKRPNYEFW